MDVSVAVSPSKLYDKQVSLGESKSFKFNVANKSKDVPGGSLKLSMTVESKVVDKFGADVDCEGLVTLDKSSLTLDVDEVGSVVATITAPKQGIIEGSYILYIDFIQQPVTGVATGNQTNVIRVPVYIFIGSSDVYSSLKVDFDMLDTYVGIGSTIASRESSETTVLKESISSCISVLNPFNIVNTYRGILDRPMYNFKTATGNVLDINNSIYTELENVVTSGDKLTDVKYVHYDKSWVGKKVQTSKKNSASVDIDLEDGVRLSIAGTDASLSYIQEQLSNMASSGVVVDLQYLLSNLKVPKNKGYEKAFPLFLESISSTSDIPITVEGTYKVTKDATELVVNKTVKSQTIMPGETLVVSNALFEKELYQGRYDVVGTTKVRDVEKKVNFSFQVESKRWVIVLSVSIFLAIYTCIASVVLLKLVKLFRRRVKVKTSGKVDETTLSM